MNRRDAFTRMAASAALLLSPSRLLAAVEASPRTAPEAVVHLSPTCGCCKVWVDHLRESGLATSVREAMGLDALKDRLGVPRALRSCHTAEIDGYVVEGHVPAAEVVRMLRERPAIVGIAVPGMPIGSPGMEVPGRKPDAYEIVAFDGAGGTYVYARR